MSFYIDDLYKNVIQEPANYFNELKIISGYASSKFLNRVIEDFPNHKFHLIIGMALQGISLNDHQEFKRICTEFENVKVFYYSASTPNHMKIYQWYNNDICEVSFIGSANFSESGFFRQEEILSPSIDIFSNLIEKMMSHSIFCLDEQVGDKIPIYEDERKYIEESKEYLYDDIAKENKEDIVVEYKESFNKNKIDLKKLLLRNLRLTPYNHVSLELILKDDPHWETRALNNWNRKLNKKTDSYIDIERINKSGERSSDFFPRDINIQLISDDNVEWTVKRVGEYGKALTVIDGINFYEYFKQRLSIEEDRLISYEDLCDYGRTNIDIYRLSDNEYLLDFSLYKRQDKI